MFDQILKSSFLELYTGISIDGDEATHDALRGKGSYAAAIGALRHLHSVGMDTAATTVISEQSLSQLAEIETLLLAEGVGQWNLAVPRHSGRAKDSGHSIYASAIRRLSEVDASMEELLNGMNELALGGNEIVKAIGDILTIFDEIKHAHDEINKNINLISDNIAGVADISNQTSMNIEETSSSTDQINSTVTRLLEIGQQNKENIETLDNELKKFKTS